MDRMLQTRRPADDWLLYLGGEQALGWWVIGKGDDRIIAHAGETIGYTSSIAFSPKRGVGVVVLSNGSSAGEDLAMHLLRPSYPLSGAAGPPPKPSKDIAVDPKLLDSYAGKYQAAKYSFLVIDHSTQHLRFMAPGSPRVRLYAMSDKRFLIPSAGVTVEFKVDDRGQTTGLVLRIPGYSVDIPAKKVL
jgi:hypothetical protein